MASRTSALINGRPSKVTLSWISFMKACADGTAAENNSRAAPTHNPIMATLKNPGLCICFMAAYPPRGIGQNEQSPRQIDSNFGFYGLTGVLPGEQASEASHFPYIPTIVRSEPT